MLRHVQLIAVGILSDGTAAGEALVICKQPFDCFKIETKILDYGLRKLIHKRKCGQQEPLYLLSTS